MSNWYDRAVLGLKGVYGAYQRAAEGVQEAQTAADAGEITQGERVLRQAGSVATVPSYILDSAFSMLPGYETLQETIGEAVQYAAETEPGQQAVSYLQENPRTAQNLEALLNVSEFTPAGKAVAGARSARTAGQAMDRLTGPQSGGGMLLAPQDNYIPNFYGRQEVSATTPLQNMPGASAPLNPLEQRVERQIFDPSSLANRMNIGEKARAKLELEAGQPFESTKATRSAVSRGTAMLKFAGEGGKNIIRDFFSPEARALFREQGLSRTGQDIIKSHLIGSKLIKTKEGRKILEDLESLKQKYRELPKDKGRLTPEHQKVNDEIQELASKLPSRGIPKAVAEAIYQLHIGQQGGREGGLNKGLQEIAKESFLEPYNKYDTGTLSDWFVKHNRAKSDKHNVNLSSDVASTLERVILNAQKESFGDAGVPAIVVMKEPSKPLTSGNHQFDVTNTKVKKGKPVPPAAKIQRAFEALGNKETTQEALKNELQKQGLKIVGEGPGGRLYFQGGAVGSAIVEGGVNVSGFVRPDGTAAFVMSDVHDFFEKVKPVKAVIDRTLPNSLLAVSPPVFKNFLDGSSITNKAPVDKDKKVVNVRKALGDIARAKPSEQAVSLERQRQRGMLTGAGGVVAQPVFTAANQDEQQGP
jgi:hypothetical protein